MIKASRRLLANRRVRRWLIFTTVVMAVWMLTSLAVAYALTRRHGRRSVSLCRISRDWKLESLRLKTSDGEELGAWFAEGRAEGPSVLVLHGHGGRRSNSLRLGKMLASQGCAVLMISLRAHGDSTGEFDDVGFSARRDVFAAVDFLERRRPGRPVIIDGNSMGSAAAVFAAGELGHRVAAYILESPYQDLKMAVWNRIDIRVPPGLSHAAYGGLMLVSPLFLPHLDEICPVRRDRSDPGRRARAHPRRHSRSSGAAPRKPRLCTRRLPRMAGSFGCQAPATAICWVPPRSCISGLFSNSSARSRPAARPGAK